MYLPEELIKGGLIAQYVILLEPTHFILVRIERVLNMMKHVVKCVCEENQQVYLRQQGVLTFSA